jgi:hypothetical protein
MLLNRLWKRSSSSGPMGSLEISNDFKGLKGASGWYCMLVLSRSRTIAWSPVVMVTMTRTDDLTKYCNLNVLLVLRIATGDFCLVLEIFEAAVSERNRTHVTTLNCEQGKPASAAKKCTQYSVLQAIEFAGNVWRCICGPRLRHGNPWKYELSTSRHLCLFT